MNEIYLKSVVIGVLAFVCIAVAAPVAFAQTEGVQVQPAIIEDKIEPGQTYHFSIKVKNISPNERTFFLLARDISGLDERGIPVFLEGEKATAFELSAWVKLPQDAITLKPDQATEVPFAIVVPKDASPGSHFGGVFFEVKPEQLGESGAAIGSRTGTIINLRVVGDTTEEMRLREFSTSQFIYDTPPVTFNTRVDNLGNVLLRPHGLIEITNILGKKVGEIEVNKSAAAVFPGGDRDYSVVWDYEGFAIGRYQALLSFVYGEDGRKTIVRTTSFWILPLKPTLIVLGVFFGVIFAVYLMIKLYIRRKLRDMGISTRADARLHEQKYTRPVSKMTFVVFAILIFIVLFLLLLFFLFG